MSWLPELLEGVRRAGVRVPAWLLSNTKTTTFASARKAMRSFAMLTLQPWTRRLGTAFQATVLGPQYRLRVDVESLAKADSYAALLRGRQGGWLSPNDCRAETGWLRSTDPTADSIEPRVAGGRVAGEGPSGDASNTSNLEEHRHASD